MATRTITQFVDDLNGSEDGVETVWFGLHGTGQEIDLTKENQATLEAALAPYLAVARKASAAPSVPGRRGSTPKNSGTPAYDAKAVRVQAGEHGIAVTPRGCIPGALILQY